MTHTVFLLAVLILPVIALTVLRINAVMVFLSLCLGEVLVQYVASDANSLLKLFAPNVSQISTSTIQLVVLLLPAVLTSIFMMLSVHGRGKTLLNLLPAAGTGLLAALLIVPMLPAGTRFAIQAEPLWSELSKLQSLIVGGSAIVSLFFLWAQRRRAVSKEE